MSRKKTGTIKSLFYFFIFLFVLAYLKELFILLVIILGIAGIIYLVSSTINEMKTNKKLRQIADSGIYEIDNMSGQEFEIFLNTLFRKLGYKVLKRTQASNDYGADIIIRDTTNGIKIAVQTKRYDSNVNISAVQEVNSAINYYGCDQGLVVTNSHLTKSARKLADSINNVDFWERNDLIEILNSVNNINE